MIKFRGKQYKATKYIFIPILIGLLILAAAVYYFIGYVLPKAAQEREDSYGNIQNVETTDITEDTHGDDYTLTGDKFIVKVFDVGQGSSTLIDYGDTEVLIDGGYYNEDNLNTLLEDDKGLSKYVTDGRIEYIIATHSDADHIGCLSKVIEKYGVGKIIYGDLLSDNASLDYFVEAAKKKNIEMEEDSDTVISLGKNANITIFDVCDNDSNDVNANSVVTLIQYGETYFFSDGDLPVEEETALRGKLPACDVVIAGHHGSSDSNSLLDELKPSYFVISCGKAAKDGTKQGNVYGHPHAEVLEEAIELNATCFGTWKSGNIVFTSDGMSVTCSADPTEALSVEDAGAKE